MIWRWWVLEWILWVTPIETSWKRNSSSGIVFFSIIYRDILRDDSNEIQISYELLFLFRDGDEDIELECLLILLVKSIDLLMDFLVLLFFWLFLLLKVFSKISYLEIYIYEFAIHLYTLLRFWHLMKVYQ